MKYNSSPKHRSKHHSRQRSNKRSYFKSDVPDTSVGVVSSQVRLQKFLSQCGVASRRHAEQLIQAGDVEVNNQTVTELGVKINPLKDVVRVKRRIVKPATPGVILLNKPRGVVSTLHDPEGRPTISDFLTKHTLSYFPVGRLDYDSTGLLILTNDGELAERLMHPRYGFERVYQVRVQGKISEKLLSRIESGVKLVDGWVKGQAKFIRCDEDTTWLEITVTEGRNRVVRRLMEKLHHPVIKLKRVSYGPFKLGNLNTGDIRQLSEKDYQICRTKVLAVKPVLKSSKVVKEQG